MSCPTCNAQLRELFTTRYCPACDAREGEPGFQDELQDEPDLTHWLTIGTISADTVSTGCDMLGDSHDSTR